MLIFRVYNMDLTRFSLIALLFNTIYCWYDPNTKTISTTRFAPQSLSHITSLIKILRLRPDNINGEIVEHNLIETMDINKDGKTVVLFNGHPSDDSPAPFKDLSAALFMHGIENIIFIFIDYTEHHITFMDGLILVDSFGGYIAPMLHKLRIPHDNYHFIGHCLGAEVAASTLRELQKLEPQKINRFTAFDPYYSNSSKILNLDNVVKFTDAYHAGIYDPIFPPFGNVDFYPNGGIFQPSCKKLKVVNERMKCDHKSSIYYYINSMDIKVNAIETKFDEDKKYLIVMDYPKFVTFGHSVDQSESGSFYLPTSEEDPFLLTHSTICGITFRVKCQEGTANHLFNIDISVSKGNNGDNHPDNSRCSNAPTRLIIGKHINWTTTYDDNCGEYKIPDFDLGPIKKLIENEFFQQSTNCKLNSNPIVAPTEEGLTPIPFVFPLPFHSTRYPAENHKREPPEEKLSVHIPFICPLPFNTKYDQLDENILVPYEQGGKEIVSEPVILPHPPVEPLIHIHHTTDRLIIEGSKRECKPTYIRKDSYGRPIPSHLWTREIYDIKQWPLPDYCLAAEYDASQILISSITEGTTATIGEYSLYGLERWIVENPRGQFVVVLIHEKWSVKQIEAIQDNFPLDYVLIADWSMYTYNSYIFTIAYAKLVGETLAKWIHSLDIPVDKLTLIGYSLSAHSVGFVGKVLKKLTGISLYKIIALDPDGLAFSHSKISKTDRLSLTDAQQVLVIHTDNQIGYPYSLGTIDVFVNDHTEGQPWCDEKDDHFALDRCSHISVLDIFYYILKYGPVYPKNSEKGQLLGFPSSISMTETGDYHLKIPEHGTSNLIFDLDNSVISISDSVDLDKKISVLNESLSENRWLVDNPSGKIVVVIINKEINENWLKSLFIGLHKIYPVLKIYVVDWSGYTFKNDEITRVYVPLLSDIITEWITESAASRTILIGTGINAYVAGLVGKKLHLDYRSVLHQIIALNPPYEVYTEHLLTNLVARQVLLIDAYHFNYGEIPGIVDIKIDHGHFYCGGEVDESNYVSLEEKLVETECLDNVAFKYFIQLFQSKAAHFIDSTGQAITGSPLEVGSIPSGLYFSSIHDLFVEYVLPNAPFGFDASKITISDSERSYPAIPNDRRSRQIHQWLDRNPDGRVFIAITYRKNINDSQFDTFVKELSSSPGPKYILIINWLEYYYPSHYTNDYLILVSNALANWLMESRIPVKSVTLLGSNENAQVASLIGKIVKQNLQEPISKIIVFNPEGETNYFPKKYYLSSTDASQVLVIHVQSEFFSIPLASGTVDVFIQFVGKTDCKGYKRKHCINNIIDLLLKSINEITLPIIDNDNRKLEGFPYNVDIDTSGVYKLFVKINEKGLYVGVPPSSNILTVFPDNFKSDDIRVLSNGESISITSGSDKEIFRNVVDNVVIIFTDNEHLDTTWVHDLQAELAKLPSTVVISLDVSSYNKYYTSKSINYVKAIGFAVAEWFKVIHLNPEKVTLIGLGHNAHLAGIVGKYVKEYSIVRRILALNPEAAFWVNLDENNRLSPSDAKQVIVIHTETSQVGFPTQIGSIDIFVNDPKKPQPRCTGPDELICSHLYSAEILIQGLRHKLDIIHSSDGRILTGFPFDLNIYENGNFKLNTEEDIHIIVEPYNPLINDVVLKTTHNRDITIDDVRKWLEKYPVGEIVVIIVDDDDDWLTKLPSITDDTYSKKLVVFYCKFAYAESIEESVDVLAKWIYEANIPQDSLILVGYGANANIAGLVCKYLQLHYFFLPRSIIAFNPIEEKHISHTKTANITNDDARQVMVVHTDHEQSIDPTQGSINLLVNGASGHICQGLSSQDCFRFMALELFKVYVVHPYSTDYPYERDIEIPLPFERGHNGLYIIDINDIEDKLITLKEEEPISITYIPFDGVNIYQSPLDEHLKHWLTLHPKDVIAIIIDGGEVPVINWSQQISEILIVNYPEIFSLVLDWSGYNDKTSAGVSGHGEALVTSLAGWIHEIRQPLIRVVLIGVGKSAHIAGLVGKYLHNVYLEPLYKIIAFNPDTTTGWIKLPKNQRLSESDADQVLAIHVNELPHDVSFGSISVILNNTQESLCTFADPQICSQVFAINTVISVLQHKNNIQLKNTKTEYLVGFPLKIEIDIVGLYSDSDLILESQDTSTLTIVLSGDSLSFSRNPGIILKWLKVHPDGEIVFILDGGESSNNTWKHQVLELLQSNTVKFPIIIDWSQHRLEALSTNLKFIDFVTDSISRWIMEQGISGTQITLFGVGKSAHIAGLIARDLKLNHHNLVSKIIAVNPSAWSNLPIKDKLSKADAVQVLVIHSIVSDFGYLSKLGTLDVVVTDLTIPWRTCIGYHWEECLYREGLQAFINSVKELELHQTLTGYPFNTEIDNTGTFKIVLKTTEDLVLSHIPPDFNEDQLNVIDNGNTQSLNIVKKIDLNKWLVENPNGEVIIVIIDDDNGIYDSKWPLQLIVEFSETYPPRYVIVIDWSSYSKFSDDKVILYARYVAFAIAKWIATIDINTNLLTLIGFGHSAHVAGLVGKQLQQDLRTPNTIIALNPSGNKWFYLPENERLHKYDARQVIVIHTETSVYGYPVELGTIDVFVNNPSKGQLSCTGPDWARCSHSIAISIFLESIKRTPVVKNAEGKKLTGFPLEVDISIVGYYSLETEVNGHAMTVDIDDFNPSYILLEEPDKTSVSIEENKGEKIHRYFNEHPNGELILIFVDNEASADRWLETISILSTDDLKYILLVDWTHYIPLHSDTILPYSKLVAHEIAKWIALNHIPLYSLTLIAFGHSAHLAGMIGTELSNGDDNKIHKIIALNPTGKFWEQIPSSDRLNKNSALQVLVIHTETKAYGYPISLGTVDVYVNNPKKGQPSCIGAESEKCSHLQSIILFRQYLHEVPYIIRSEYGDVLSGFPLNIKIDVYGVYTLNEVIEPKILHDFDISNLLLINFDNKISLGHSDGADIKRFLIDHPNGEIIIILIDEDHKWLHDLYNVLQKEEIPRYIGIVDWSEYKQISYDKTSLYIKLVADALARWIVEVNIPVDRLILIGFSENAHLAGFIGKYLQVVYESHLSKIIALNPAGNQWTFEPESERLCDSDAYQVVVIHTETKNFGYANPIGTIDIYINYPSEGQPNCLERRKFECSHYAAIKYLVDTIRRKYSVLKDINGFTLTGFPFNISENGGIYHILTDISAEQKVPKIPTEFHDEEIAVLSGNMTFMSIIDINSDEITRWLIENPRGEVIIFINADEAIADDWLKEFVRAANHPVFPKYVMDINWSKYRYPSFSKTMSYGKAVAQMIAKWIIYSNIPVQRLTLIAFGTSAHIAGYVGKFVLRENSFPLKKIIALNPMGLQWIYVLEGDRLSSTDASQVLVIHTETSLYGYPTELGTIDVFVNIPKEGQPNCSGHERLVCSHTEVINIFLESIHNSSFTPLSYDGETLHGFPLNIELLIQGSFNLKTIQETDILSKPIDPADYKDTNIITVNETVIHLWAEQNRDGEIYIVITAREEEDYKWIDKFNYILSQSHSSQYILAVDWSPHKHDTYRETVPFARFVASLVGKWLNRVHDYVDQITLIGFETSAHVAGLVGKYVQEHYGFQIKKIVGLNPAGQEWVYLPESERLSPSDAKQVLVIHTETTDYGYPYPLGTVDLFINNPEVGQPWCFDHYKAKCSHFSAVDIFLEGITGRLINVIYGFPLSIDLDEHHVLNVEIRLKRERYISKPEGFDENGLKIVLSKENSISLTKMDLAPLETWLQHNPRGEIVVYIIESEAENPLWASDAVNHFKYLNQYTVIVDWSEYKVSSFDTTFSNIQIIADIFAKWIQANEIPTDRLILVGFGTTAHLAGFVGKYILEDLQKPVYKIIALNPRGVQWNRMPQSQRLNDADAKQVVIIHTETKELGFPTIAGTIDIFINTPEDGQPWCEGPSRINCSDSAAVDVLLVDVSSPELQGKRNELRGYPFNINVRTRGIYNFILKLNKKIPEEVPEIDAEVLIKIVGNVSLADWLVLNEGEIVVILTGREAAPHSQWPERLAEIFIDNDFPKFVIIIDWSPFKNASVEEPSPYVNSVRDTVVKYLRDNHAPLGRIILIGFAESAQIAGLIGKKFSDGRIHKIIALDPTGGNYIHEPKTKILNETDANQVLVIHTEATTLGYPTPLGSIDIFVNDPTEGQFWCQKYERKHCSHVAAVEIFVDALDPDTQIFRKLPTELDGFPLNVKLNVHGEFHLRVSLEEVHANQTNRQVEIGTNGLSIEEIPKVALKQWISSNPTSEIFIIIIDDEISQIEWTIRIKNLLFPNYYVLVVNWSKYKQESFRESFSHIHAVAEVLSQYIIDMNLPTNQLTVVGFGESAHIAGLVGKQQLTPLHKIIALNPSGNEWRSVPNSEKLSAPDANEVLVIHTETNQIRDPDIIGTVDVFVKNSDESCKAYEERQCLHAYVLEVFLKILEIRELPEARDWLGGFPLELKHGARGPYLIESSDIYSPKHWPAERFSIHEWPKVDFSIAKRFDANNVIIKLYTPAGDVLPFNVNESQSSLKHVVQDSEAEFIFIVTEEPSNIWAINLKDVLLRDSEANHVILVDWSMYVFNSYRFTAAYSKVVADTVAAWIHENKFPNDKITVIGFDTSGHVAGLIGKRFSRIKKIIALDPARFMWSNKLQILKLDKNDADLVQVIHTNTRHFGYPDMLGHYDIYVNGGTVQPQCENSNDVDMCSHQAAITYFTNSVQIRAQAREGSVSQGHAVIQGDSTIDFGYWLIPYQNSKQGVFVLQTQKMSPYLIGFLEPNVENAASSYILDWNVINLNAYINSDIRRLILLAFCVHNGVEKHLKVPLERSPPPFLWVQDALKSEVFVILNGEEDDNINWAIDLKDKLLQTDPKSLVIIFDWHKYKYKSYRSTSEMAKPIGNKIADIIMHLNIPAEKLHIIGFSLGAHIAGFVGKRLNEQSGKTLHRITALDPAKNLWEYPSITELYRLSNIDANIVDVIHTDIDHYGILSPIGVADFYVNNGHNQPECDDVMCSHYKSVDLFIESLSTKALALKIEIKKQQLIYSTTTEFAHFGYYLEPNKTGSFLLLTNEVFPYLNGELTQRKHLTKWDANPNGRADPRYQHVISRMPNETYNFEYDWDRIKFLNRTDEIV